MQARVSGGKIPAQAAKEFGVHLKRFASAFPNAIVVAAGRKASDHSIWANIPAVHMGALTPSGSNKPSVRDSWRAAAEIVRDKLGLKLS